MNEEGALREGALKEGALKEGALKDGAAGPPASASVTELQMNAVTSARSVTRFMRASYEQAAAVLLVGLGVGRARPDQCPRQNTPPSSSYPWSQHSCVNRVTRPSFAPRSLRMSVCEKETHLIRDI